jgi:L-alanine-DL-glutamate epimerase-like enolase superfamily enzyme
MAALRREAGPDIDLMVDFVQGSAPRPWPKATVLEAVEAVGAYRPLWIEEPFPIEDRASYRDLRSRVKCAVAGGEGITSLDEAAEFLDADALDIIQPDPTIAGGITLCKLIAALAYSRRVEVAWHSWGGAVSLMANLHLALASPGTTAVEYCRLYSPFRDEVLIEPLRILDGFVQPPPGYGLGVELTDDLIHRHPYRSSAGHSFDWESPAGVEAASF